MLVAGHVSQHIALYVAGPAARGPSGLKLATRPFKRVTMPIEFLPAHKFEALLLSKIAKI